MDEEIEDIVGEVKYTDSQKSVATANLQPMTYSPDFTDSSSDKNTSFGKETYVIEWDSEDDSFPLFPLKDSKSVINLKDRANRRVSIKSDTPPSEHNSLQSALTSLNSGATVEACTPGSPNSYCTSHRSLIVQETCTQTSKTIIQLAENEGAFPRPEQHTLETQTSMVSITENKTTEYLLEFSRTRAVQYEPPADPNMSGDTVKQESPVSSFFNFVCNKYTEQSLLDTPSQFCVPESRNEDNKSETSSEQIIRITDDASLENSDEGSDKTRSTGHDFDSPTLSDMEEDSLMVPTNSTTSNIDINELREKLNERVDLCRERYCVPDSKRFGTLTTLTEESNCKRDSLPNVTPFKDLASNESQQDEVLFTSNAGIRVKLLKDDDFRLPPIQNQSCPNSPQMNPLFTNKLHKLYKAGTLPCLYDRSTESTLDRWQSGGKNLAAGESALIESRNDPPRRNISLLPPIPVEGSTVSSCKPRKASPCQRSSRSPVKTLADTQPICIKEKIKELKCNDKKPWSHATKFNSVSYDVIETLEELPKVMERFWRVISEHRIADLLRLINSLMESPRPQVSRAACSTAAVILTNTTYTKKPDFYETMALLLNKTGSYSLSVRRSANVALDDAVCALPHAPVTAALCLHGVGHKSPLVRCASARLLVVSCALAGGGRGLLRTRPPTAGAARRLALRALAALLDDKSTDTRKYAERLYVMLRPLKNFEAYYLTDVQVDTAARQMKKYDQLLVSGQKEAT